MVWDYLIVGFIGWVAGSVWNKHGSKAAQRLPVLEKIGLAEPPSEVTRRKARVSINHKEKGK